MKSKYRNDTTFKKGHNGYKYWLGKKRDPETNNKIREKLRGKPVALKNGEFIRATGENNNKWVGDKVGYSGIHHWLTHKFGQPSNCEICGNTSNKKRYEWALLRGKTYKRIRNYYIRLCKGCHNNYDGTSIQYQK